MNKNKPAGFHCRDCTKRSLGCHSTCEEYLADKAEYERIKAIQNEGKEARTYSNETYNERMDKKAKRGKRTVPHIVK